MVALLLPQKVLIEGVLVWKTLLSKLIAGVLTTICLHSSSPPTPMPSDVTGHALWRHETLRTKIRRGPVFTNLLFADEINRHWPKPWRGTSSSKKKKQITIEGKGFGADTVHHGTGDSEPHPLPAEQPFWR